jgi:(1->4)-alpha-D-glucan 1-alpha-D-glucosylmutase
MREAKQHTTWVAVDEAHEAAVQSFARALLTHRDFLRDFLPFQRRVAEAGDRAALEDPPPKLDLILRALALRAERPEAFAGGYEPLPAGPDAVAFVRGGDVIAAALLRGEPVALTLPAGDWRNVLTDTPVSGPFTLASIALLKRT